MHAQVGGSERPATNPPAREPFERPCEVAAVQAVGRVLRARFEPRDPFRRAEHASADRVRSPERLQRVIQLPLQCGMRALELLVFRSIAAPRPTREPDFLQHALDDDGLVRAAHRPLGQAEVEAVGLVPDHQPHLHVVRHRGLAEFTMGEELVDVGILPLPAGAVARVVEIEQPPLAHDERVMLFVPATEIVHGRQ